MKKAILLAGLLAGISSVATAQTATAEADVSLGKISNQYICTFDGSVSSANVRAETSRAVGRSMGEVLHTYHTAIRGFAVRMAATPGGRSAVAELRANNPKIAACEQDQRVRALVRPPWERDGGGDTPEGEEEPWGITRVGGPGSTATGKTAWIIDTGIDLDHPDLNVDIGRSRSFIRDSSPDDANGHGTHVAGTIAAIDNEIGVIGVSPGTTVVSVRVLDRRGSGSWSGVIAGVDYVAANGGAGDVANMSLGGGFSQTVNDAVVSAANGIHFAIAAGNSDADANNYSPASAEGDFVYTVSAIDSNGALASFSNWGNPPIDWAEPGVSVNSTYKDGGYRTLSGTSMAAPHLAGILVQGGVTQCGTASGDPDGEPDPIGCR